MTIGPEPRIRIFERSVRFGIQFSSQFPVLSSQSDAVGSSAAILQWPVPGQPSMPSLKCKPFHPLGSIDDFAFLALPGAMKEIAPYSPTEHSGAAGHDVDVVAFLFSHSFRPL